MNQYQAYTCAYLADVFIDQSNCRSVMQHSALQGLRRFMLAAADAHGLYQQFEFPPLNKPEWIIEIAKPDIYKPVRIKANLTSVIEVKSLQLNRLTFQYRC